LIRDEELNRLVRYAQGMGISVRFKPYVKRSLDQAAWTIDGSEITVYVTERTSKLENILSLIHELGHHKAFVDNDRTICPKLEEALDADDNKKRQRKAIYLDEVSGTKYWLDIYRDTNCQFNIDKLHKQIDFDLWCYKVYCDTGKFPVKKEKIKKKRQLKEKYGC